MLKAIILDDEPRGGRLLSHKLQLFAADIELLTVFNDPFTALKEIGRYQPDVLFLDVEMPGMNGFQFLERLAGFQFEVIFTTAYDAYTLDALRLSVVDYLLKPIGEDDLRQAIGRLKKRMERKNVQALNTPDRFSRKRLSLATAEGIYLIEKTHIIRIEAMSNYCTFHLTGNKKIVVSKTLKEYEAQLAGDTFIRVNRSSMININFITRYRKGNGGTLEMADGMEIEVSPQKKDELMALLFDPS
ncbi:LytR/AlgR family response regulator transcription factor [Parapedobacter lycopersici]|uniref:LytR/AlgR family response regulator transcription factor n=1 Tax=Parapedobacter lycopersici TaxID=1864939 RepID=UPI00214D7F24|nr:LytTR family DNA-binding domain-containing protein [Parapedobacter lycopersici]